MIDPGSDDFHFVLVNGTLSTRRPMVSFTISAERCVVTNIFFLVVLGAIVTTFGVDTAHPGMAIFVAAKTKEGVWVVRASFEIKHSNFDISRVHTSIERQNNGCRFFLVNIQDPSNRDNS